MRPPKVRNGSLADLTASSLERLLLGGKRTSRSVPATFRYRPLSDGIDPWTEKRERHMISGNRLVGESDVNKIPNGGSE